MRGPLLAGLLLLVPLGLQGNQALYPGLGGQQNPASLNTRLAEDQKAALTPLAGTGIYLELPDMDQLDKKIEDLSKDLDTLSILERNNQEFASLSEDNQQRVRSLERHSNQCRAEQLDGRNLVNLAACYQGVADSLNEGLLDELEKSGQLRAGYQFAAPAYPIHLRLATLPKATFSLGAGFKNQIKGQVMSAPVSVNAYLETREVTGSSQNPTPGANLTVGLNQLGATYAVLDRLSARYQSEPNELFAEYDDQQLYEQEATDDEKFVRVVQFELQEQAGYTDEQLQDIQDLADRIRDDPELSEALEEGRLELLGEADFSTATSLEARRARITYLNFSLSQEFSHLFDLNRSRNQLHAGVTLNYYQARMHRALVSVMGLEDQRNLTTSGATAERRARNHFDEGYRTEQGLGVDFGLVWQTPRIRLGATLYNLNEPSFNFGNLNDQFQDPLLSPGGNLRDKDQQALEELLEEGRINLNKKATLTRHLVVDSGYRNPTGRWGLEAYFTLGKATNLVGDQYQNLGVQHYLNFDNPYLQQTRWGFSQNLAGTQVTALELGASFTNWLHLNVAFTPQTSDFLGSSYPQYLSANLSVQKKL
ncbi:plasmid transfer operon, TraF, protein [Marinospirillum celere]|uniref:Plasmid transfer operon, TraF, protein n=1 Tax=Marinospirillum celere TaxID=1122252 RepID=A0A1I1E9R0_9GAMM|nr:conjugal transfer protein TraF [Marinospirillum celere]SFB83456.1 plasmid transfer operon, TraF, protein [Marinospirillum celere]